MVTFIAQAQTEVEAIKDFATSFKTSEVKVKDYQIKKTETVYDLVLNLSYFHHISTNLAGEHLILLIVLVDKQLIAGEFIKRNKHLRNN